MVGHYLVPAYVVVIINSTVFFSFSIFHFFKQKVGFLHVYCSVKVKYFKVKILNVLSFTNISGKTFDL